MSVERASRLGCPFVGCLVRFSKSVGKGKSISLTMITVKGITHTGHWSDIHNIITAEDLFER